ncbi:MAG: 30S ribosome-binding factor RbfA [Myxococcota bacterium]|nr:30S ribosome-binding factor RbfA [Myxococcota bacterium]
MKGSDRTLRVAGLIQREVASALLEDARDPALRAVTVTRVRVSGDLRHATVMFMTGAAMRSDAEGRLRLILPLVQRRVGRNLSMRYTPRLKFEYDEGVEAGIRVGEILDGLGLGGEDAEPDGTAEDMGEERGGR